MSVQIGKVNIQNFPLLLAPMEDVSDPPFRYLCKQHGADVVYTEFISSEGLLRYADKSVKKLDIYPEERPIGIQIFGNNIESMRVAAQIVEEVEPDFIDINYGCPVKKVACKGAGAGILLDLPKMEAMTRELVRSVGVPVTVKTRLGWDSETIRIVEVALRLQDAGISALSIHGRTRQQMYKGSADWSHIGEVCAHPDVTIPIFGNGDIDSAQKALAYRERYGVQGIMIGRAAIGNPWIFEEIKHFFATGEELPPPSLPLRVEAIRTHVARAVAWKGLTVAIHEMRPHYGRYIHTMENAKDWRMQLMKATAVSEIEDVLGRMLEAEAVTL